MGFPKERFIDQDKIPSDVICPICRDVVDSPKQCPNGHVFCYVCIVRWFDENECCPIDKQDLDEGCLYDCLIAKQWVSELIVKCENDGCEWNGQYKTVEHHDRDCEMKGVNCSDCDEAMLRKHILDHKSEKCHHRLVQCELGCEKPDLKFKDVEAHTEECPNRLVVCQWCADKFMFKEQHPDKCGEKLVNCEWCNDKMFQRDLEEHKSDCEFRTIKCEDCNENIVFNEIFEHLEVCINRHRECPNCDWSGKFYPEHESKQCRGPLVRCDECGEQYRKNRRYDHTLQPEHISKAIDMICNKIPVDNGIISTANSVAFNRGAQMIDEKLHQSVYLTSFTDKEDTDVTIDYALPYYNIPLKFKFVINKHKDDGRFIGIYFDRVIKFDVELSGQISCRYIFVKNSERKKYDFLTSRTLDTTDGLHTGRTGVNKYVTNWGNKGLLKNSCKEFGFNNGAVTIQFCVHFELDEPSILRLKKKKQTEVNGCTVDDE